MEFLGGLLCFVLIFLPVLSFIWLLLLAEQKDR